MYASDKYTASNIYKLKRSEKIKRNRGINTQSICFNSFYNFLSLSQLCSLALISLTELSPPARWPSGQTAAPPRRKPKPPQNYNFLSLIRSLNLSEHESKHQNFKSLTTNLDRRRKSLKKKKSLFSPLPLIFVFFFFFSVFSFCFRYCVCGCSCILCVCVGFCVEVLLLWTFDSGVVVFVWFCDGLWYLYDVASVPAAVSVDWVLVSWVHLRVLSLLATDLAACWCLDPVLCF
jgi:hypothetical protein